MLCDLSSDDVRKKFAYDETLGVLRYRNATVIRGKVSPAGTVAGAPNKEGYRYIKINHRAYRASRLIWLHQTGNWPTHQIDHKDRNTRNDKWENLREATSSQNKANCSKYQNKSCALKGVQAVQKRKSIRYRAVATKDGVSLHLGYFDTPELAHAAYLKASEGLHGDFANG